MRTRSTHATLAAAFAALTATLVFSSAAAAQSPAPPVDDATRSSARRLGDEANALFDAGDFAGALDKYDRADALVHVPTLGVRAARSLVKLGRLVEASERYLTVTRMQLPADALAVHRDALVEAEGERSALTPRIPSVLITVVGAPDAEVTIDGKPLPRALLGAARAIDPGAHKVQARRGADVQSSDVKAAEGETVRVTLTFTGAPTPVPVTPQAASKAPAGGEPDQGNPGSANRTVGFIGLGLGVVGLGVGAVTGLMASGKKSDLETNCGPDLQCGPLFHDDADSYNGLRTVSTVGFIAGAVAGAAGAVLLLTAPSGASSKASAGVTPWVGAGSAGVTGRF